MIDYARKRGERTMPERLAGEIMMRLMVWVEQLEKEETHKMAEANKAFAHYRW